MKKGIILILIVMIILSTGTICAYFYTASNVKYSNSNITVSNVQQAIEKLYSNICPDNMYCQTRKKWNNVEIGDYISMTPTKTNYTTDKNKTGYDSTQTIYPSELKLWRVIRKNSNGTVDIISENISSTNIYFKGIAGYANYVGYLNTLAKQYENPAYTVGSRYMGYNGQTEYITDTAAFNGTGTTAPWTCSTGGACNPTESTGGGDKLYTTDLDLVKSAIGTLITRKCNDANCNNPVEQGTYWLASRYYYYSVLVYPSYEFNGRYVDPGLTLFWSSMRTNFIANNTSNWNDYGFSRALRPIVTLKSGLKVGDALGTREDPFVLG